MSTYFSKVIKAGERLREFNFRQLMSPADNLYHIDVSDDRGNRVIFKMHKEDDGQWKFVTQPLPEWVSSIEGPLSDAIKEQLQQL